MVGRLGIGFRSAFSEAQPATCRVFLPPRAAKLRVNHQELFIPGKLKTERNPSV